MNNERRKQIQKIMDQLADIRLEIETIQDEEQEYFDRMPESLQSGEKGTKSEEAVEFLDNAADYCDNVVDELTEAIQ